MNVNKRPISLDNVSSTVTDLVTHLLQKSGLATRAENTDNTTNIDDDDDDDVCITRMEPARGLSAQRQQQRTQVIPAPTQRSNSSYKLIYIAGSLQVTPVNYSREKVVIFRGVLGQSRVDCIV